MVVIGGLVIGCDGGVNNLGLPVVFDKVLKIFPIGGSGVGDIIVGKPSFELGLVPLIVCYISFEVSLEIVEK